MNTPRSAIGLLVALLAACASGPGAASPSASEDLGRRFVVSDDGRELVILCEGTGSPTILLEDGIPSGAGGIGRFRFSDLWAELVTETRVCTYDRAGYGASDPAPLEPRTADDVVDDLNTLLEAAEEGPFVLVGSSGGGMIVSYYAAREPEDVVGVVLLDVPAPVTTLTLVDAPSLAWDHPENPEHLDIIDEFEGRFARQPERIQAPLVVVTASYGQSDADDQAFWLQISPDAIQVELSGSHGIAHDNPEGVAALILDLLEADR